MKQIICEKPYQFRMHEVTQPRFVKGEALIQIKRIGICGTDLHAYQGNQPFFTYPRVLGHELSGEVIEIGSNKQNIRVGDKVAIIPYIACHSCVACKSNKNNCCENMEVIGVHRDGGMCEVISVPIENLIQANDLSYEEAALLEPISIGAHAVARADLTKKQVVAVIGAGPIGLGVMKLAKLKGHDVIALDTNKERLLFSKAWANVDKAIVVSEHTTDELNRLTNGHMPSVVFEATGNVHSMNQSFHYTAHGGKLVFVGLVNDNIVFHDPSFHSKELTLYSSRNANLQDFMTVKTAMKEKKLDVKDFISHHTSFEKIIYEYDNYYNLEENVIKAMVTVG